MFFSLCRQVYVFNGPIYCRGIDVSISPGCCCCKPLGWCSATLYGEKWAFGGPILFAEWLPDAEWDKQWPQGHLHRLCRHSGWLYQIYTLQAPISGQATPVWFWTLFLPVSALSGYIPGRAAEPHISFAAFHLADCSNLPTTKLCRLHHFGIYTAPNYSQWAWLPLAQKPLLKYGLGNRSGGCKSEQLNQNGQHRNTCWHWINYIPKGSGHIKQYYISLTHSAVGARFP